MRRILASILAGVFLLAGSGDALAWGPFDWFHKKSDKKTTVTRQTTRPDSLRTWQPSERELRARKITTALTVAFPDSTKKSAKPMTMLDQRNLLVQRVGNLKTQLAHVQAELARSQGKDKRLTAIEQRLTAQLRDLEQAVGTKDSNFMVHGEKYDYFDVRLMVQRPGEPLPIWNTIGDDKSGLADTVSYIGLQVPKYVRDHIYDVATNYPASIVPGMLYMGQVVSVNFGGKSDLDRPSNGFMEVGFDSTETLMYPPVDFNCIRYTAHHVLECGNLVCEIQKIPDCPKTTTRVVTLWDTTTIHDTTYVSTPTVPLQPLLRIVGFTGEAEVGVGYEHEKLTMPVEGTQDNGFSHIIGTLPWSKSGLSVQVFASLNVLDHYGANNAAAILRYKIRVPQSAIIIGAGVYEDAWAHGYKTYDHATQSYVDKSTWMSGRGGKLSADFYGNAADSTLLWDLHTDVRFGTNNRVAGDAHAVVQYNRLVGGASIHFTNTTSQKFNVGSDVLTTLASDFRAAQYKVGVVLGKHPTTGARFELDGHLDQWVQNTPGVWHLDEWGGGANLTYDDGSNIIGAGFLTFPENHRYELQINPLAQYRHGEQRYMLFVTHRFGRRGI